MSLYLSVLEIVVPRAITKGYTRTLAFVYYAVKKWWLCKIRLRVRLIDKWVQMVIVYGEFDLHRLTHLVDMHNVCKMCAKYYLFKREKRK